MIHTKTVTLSTPPLPADNRLWMVQTDVKYFTAPDGGSLGS